MSSVESYYLVAVNTPFNNSLLTYKGMLDESENLKKGRLVKVPLGKRIIDGCILKQLDSEALVETDLKKIKQISSIEADLLLGE